MCLLIIPVLLFAIGAWAYAGWWAAQALSHATSLMPTEAAWCLALSQLTLLLTVAILARAWHQGKRWQPVTTIWLTAALAGAVIAAAQPVIVVISAAVIGAGAVSGIALLLSCSPHAPP